MERVLVALRGEGIVPRWDRVVELVLRPRPQLPGVPRLVVNLAEYDHLLFRKEEVLRAMRLQRICCCAQERLEKLTCILGHVDDSRTSW